MGLALGGQLILPQGYVSGTALSGTATWANQTLASLGLTPGQYVYTWGANATADSLTINLLTTSPLVVTTPFDSTPGTATDTDGQTSLREALAYAAKIGGAQTITFSTSNANGAANFSNAQNTITLNGTELAINSSVTIIGPGAGLLTIDASKQSRVFNIGSGNLNVTLSGLTVANGIANFSAGGGIFNISAGAVTLTNCTLSGNTAQEGGGILNGGSGTLTLIASTLSGNSASNLGGGMANFGSGVVTLTNCTFSGNSADPNSGGGIYSNGSGAVTMTNCTLSGNYARLYGGCMDYMGSGAVTLTNCTISGNRANDGNGIYNGNGTVTLKNTICVDGVTGNTVNAGSDSILGGTATTAGLQVDGMGNPVLQNNGGPTQTIALVPGSPAIDAGNNALAVDVNGNPLTTDQRGLSRIVGGTVDIGAFEAQPVPATFGNPPSGLTYPQNSGPIDLSALLNPSATGTFSGDGVSNNVFNPAGLGYGAHNITFTSTDAYGHPATTQFSIVVTEAQSFVVTTTSDTTDSLDGLTSLREALAYAATLSGTPSITFGDGSAITGGTNFNDGTAHTITLNGTQLIIDSNVTVTGPGANVLTIDALHATRAISILDFGNAPNVTLSGLTIANGNSGGGDSGGGILDSTAGTVTLTNCALTGNMGYEGGGFISSRGGTAILTNCTISGNSAILGGGGLGNGNGCTLTLINSTISGNSASAGGGIDSLGGVITLINSTIAGNSSTSGAGGIDNEGSVAITLKNTICVDGTSGTIASGTDSIVGGTAAAAGLQVDGMGDPVLQNNGGPTQTIALVPGSPAIDAGNNALAVDANGNPLTTDQRGAPRIQRGFAGSAMAIVDIGAYESLAVPAFTQGAVAVVNGGTVNLVNTAGVSPAGGTFSGVGAAAGHVDPVTGVFNSAGLPLGVYQVTYTVSDGFGAMNSVNIAVTVAETPSLVVTTTSDNSTNTDGVTSLREAIAYASSGNAGTNPVITFDHGIDGQTITLTQGELDVTSAMKIQGNGPANTIVDGNNATLIFRVNDETTTQQAVTITGMTLQHGHGSGGGAIENEENLTLAYNVIAHNVTVGPNGTGGAGIYNDGTLISSNNTIAHNSATVGGPGGGIRNWGTLESTNDTIAYNSAHVVGGGICADSGSMTLTNCTIAGNISDDGAGGIYVRSGISATVTLKNTIDADDNAGTFTSGGHNLISTGADGFANGVEGDIVGTDGSPIDAKLGPLQDNGGPTPTIALLPGSKAIDAGSNALAVDANGNPLTTDQRGLSRIVGGTVDIGAFEVQTVPVTFGNPPSGLTYPQNSGPIDLSALLNPSTTGTFSGDGVSNNVFNPAGLGYGAHSITFTSTDAYGHTVTLQFSIVVTEAPSLVVTTTNDVVSNADGVTSLREALAYAATLSGPQTITFGDGSAITGGTNFNDGAAHTITLNGTELVVKSSVVIAGPGADKLTISGNQASRIFNMNFSDLTFNVTISGLTMANGRVAVSSFGNSAYGAAIYAFYNGKLTLDHCVVSNNALVNIANQQNLGGAIYRLSGPLTLTNCTVSGNTTSTGDGYGGAIFISSETLTLDHCLLDGNQANGTSAYGGAVEASGPVIATATTFSNNVATATSSSANANGGAMLINAFNNSRVTLDGCTFSGNAANSGSQAFGGALYAGGVTLGVSNCSFTGNQATVNVTTYSYATGGGIFLGATLATISDSVIDGNSTSGGTNVLGGGISAGYGTALTMVGSSVTRNSVTALAGQAYTYAYGAGLYLAANGNNLRLYNCTIAGNTSQALSVYGGGVNVSNGTLSLTNCTVSGNTAQSTGAANGNSTYGGGIARLSGTVMMANTIVAGNSVTGGSVSQGPDAFGSFTSTGSNLIGKADGATFTAATGDLVGAIATPLDPKLGPLQNNGGLGLTSVPLPGSPAIDVGSNALAVDWNGAAITTDGRGLSRTVNGTVDIGAVEAAYTTITGPATAPTYGSALNVTASVANASGGSVQFVVDSANSGSPVPLSSGTASTSLSGLGAGSHTITAVYTNGGSSPEGNANSLAQSVSRAKPSISVTGYSTTYDGTAHTATGSATGVDGAALSGLDLSRTTHTAAGTYYSDVWQFIDSTGNYQNVIGTLSDAIGKATASISVTGYSVTYDGNPHTATGSATGLGGVALSGLDLSGTLHTAAGTYNGDAWSFTDPTGNYASATGTVDDAITQPIAGIDLGALQFTYNGKPQALTPTTNPAGLKVTVTYNGSTTPPTNAGSYAIVATVTDPAHPSKATGTMVIQKALLVLTANDLARAYLTANPTVYTARYTGFVNGQTLATSGVTGTPTFGTTASLNSPIGGYPLIVRAATLAAKNYAFSFLNGTLWVDLGGFVGLNSVTIGGTSALVDSYNSGLGYAKSHSTQAIVLTNGSLTLQGAKVNGLVLSTAANVIVQAGSNVTGNAIYATTLSNAGTVRGIKSQQTTPLLSAPQPTIPSGFTAAPGVANPWISGTYSYNSATGDLVISSKLATIAAGTYRLHSLTVSGGATLQVKGAVTLQLTGQVNLSGASKLNLNGTPGNLQIATNYTGSNGVNLSGGTNAYLSLYAPGTDIKLSQGSLLFGGLVGKTLTSSDTSSLHLDIKLPAGWANFGN
jgi:hypothetical protein